MTDLHNFDFYTHTHTHAQLRTNNGIEVKRTYITDYTQTYNTKIKNGGQLTSLSIAFIIGGKRLYTFGNNGYIRTTTQFYV